MNHHLGIVILGGVGRLHPLVLMPQCVGCMIVAGVLPPPDISQLPVFDQPETSLLFTASKPLLEEPWFPRETAWQRRNRNAPWYRQFNRRR